MPTATSEPAWTAPGTFEVAPGVHRIPLPLPNDGLRAVNVYAIVDGDGLVLIDGGWAIPEARKALQTGLDRLRCSLGDIRRFLVTHVHRDHYSQAVAIRQELGTKVSLGRGERATLDVLADPHRAPLQPHLRLLCSYGASEVADHLSEAMEGRSAEGLAWEPPDDWLEEGSTTLETGRTLEVMETPGHTRGHVVFFDRGNGLLFAGDHVLPTITPSIGFEAAPQRDPLGAFLRSLARVRSLPDAVLLPAHGATAPSVHRRVDELLAHHGRRLDATEAAVARGSTTAFEVAGRLSWTRRERRFSELDLFNQMLAVFETGAHLTVLVAQGRVAFTEDDTGVRRYVIPRGGR